MPSQSAARCPMTPSTIPPAEAGQQPGPGIQAGPRAGNRHPRRSTMRHAWWQRILVGLLYLAVYQVLYWVVDQDILLASPLQILQSMATLAREPDFYLAAG